MSTYWKIGLSFLGAVLLLSPLLAAQDGGLDTTFDPGAGPSASVNALAVQPDGKILIGGAFTEVGGVPRNRVARLNADGSLDTDFDPGTGANAQVYALAAQADGKVLIGGAFTSVNNETRYRIARLNADGSLDTDFDAAATGANPLQLYYVYALAAQPDGKILLGGDFTSVNGETRLRIARLNDDGSLDTNFDPGTNLPVMSIALQANGKILIGGNFTTVNGATRVRVARLNDDGTVDADFDPGAGASNPVRTLAAQPDGKVLLGGNFDSMNNVPRGRVARLNADGSLDTDFDPGAGAYETIESLVLQLDGSVLIGGDFTWFDGQDINRVARLRPDGSLDPDFDPGTGADDEVIALALQPDGKILIGGKFIEVDGTARVRVARLINTNSLFTSTPQLTAVAGQPYTYKVIAVGNPAPTIFVAGAPDWLTFDDVDTLTGIPGEADIGPTGTITITATDGDIEDSQVFQIDVQGALPAFHSAPVTTATAGTPYSYVAEVSGIPEATLSAGELPGWLDFNPDTGELFGTPGGADLGVSQPITITATNGWGEPAEQTFTITVQSAVTGGGGGCVSSDTGRGLGAWAATLILLLAPGFAFRRRAGRLRANETAPESSPGLT